MSCRLQSNCLYVEICNIRIFFFDVRKRVLFGGTKKREEKNKKENIMSKKLKRECRTFSKGGESLDTQLSMKVGMPTS